MASGVRHGPSRSIRLVMVISPTFSVFMTFSERLALARRSGLPGGQSQARLSKRPDAHRKCNRPPNTYHPESGIIVMFPVLSCLLEKVRDTELPIRTMGDVYSAV